LEVVYIYNSQEDLKIVLEAEAKPVVKQPRGRPRKRPIEEVEDEDEAKTQETSLSESELELIECVARRMRSKRTE
jgi:hypothetical protein